MPAIGRKKIHNRCALYEKLPTQHLRRWRTGGGGRTWPNRSINPRLRTTSVSNPPAGVDHAAMVAAIQPTVSASMIPIQDDSTMRLQVLTQRVEGIAERMDGAAETADGIGGEGSGQAGMAIPPRLVGEYSSIIPSIATRFWYVKSETIELAMSGRLPPDRLSELIDPSDVSYLRAILTKDDSYSVGGVVISKPAGDASKLISNFIKAISDGL